MQDFHDDLERVAARTTTIEYEGAKYTVKCEDPFGFWRVTGGAMAIEDLQGRYTSLEAIEKAIIAWEKKKALLKIQNEDKDRRLNVSSSDGKGNVKKLRRSEYNKMMETPVEEEK